jgi:hypothetical protein
VTLERVEELVFPGDKKTRDRVHARLAKKIAAREAQKALKEQCAGDSVTGYGQKQDTGQRGQGGKGETN